MSRKYLDLNFILILIDSTENCGYMSGHIPDSHLKFMLAMNCCVKNIKFMFAIFDESCRKIKKNKNNLKHFLKVDFNFSENTIYTILIRNVRCATTFKQSPFKVNISDTFVSAVV